MIMHMARLLAITLIASLFACVHGQRTEVAVGKPTRVLPFVMFDPLAGARNDLYHWDIIQRTCALYVTIRSAALENPIPFGGVIEDSMVHWNTCAGGTMIACAVVPAANGDSVVTGIPWSH